jgi:DNA-binding NtrC family response regulator
MRKVKPSVLLVDSDREVLEEMWQVCLYSQWQTLTADSGRAALKLEAQFSVKVALVSMQLADTKLSHLIPRLRNKFPGINFIVTTSDYCEETEKEARTMGILTYLAKPLNYRLLRRVIQRAVLGREET